MKRAAFVASAAASAAALAARAGAQTPANPIRIAIAANDASALPLYAQELGYFTAGGLDATVQVLANGGAIIAAMAAGSIDVGISNVVSAVSAFKKGVPVALVTPATVYDGSVPQVPVVVPKSSPLRTAQDLEGKTIATNPIRGIGDLATELWMQQHGADPASVKWIEMPLAEMAPAMLQKRIDAANLTEPFFTANRATMRIMAAPLSAVAPRFINIGFIGSTAWANAHQDTVARFSAVMRRSAAWANAHHHESGIILAAHAKMDPQLVDAMQRVKYAEGMTPAEVQPNIDLAARYRLIDAPFPAREMMFPPPRA